VYTWKLNQSLRWTRIYSLNAPVYGAGAYYAFPKNPLCRDFTKVFLLLWNQVACIHEFHMHHICKTLSLLKTNCIWASTLLPDSHQVRIIRPHKWSTAQIRRGRIEPQNTQISNILTRHICKTFSINNSNYSSTALQNLINLNFSTYDVITMICYSDSNMKCRVDSLKSQFKLTITSLLRKNKVLKIGRTNERIYIIYIPFPFHSILQKNVLLSQMWWRWMHSVYMDESVDFRRVYAIYF